MNRPIFFISERDKIANISDDSLDLLNELLEYNEEKRNTTNPA